MPKIKITIARCAIAYGIAAFLTFGWYSGGPCKEQPYRSCAIEMPFLGIYAGIIWPFYWAYKISTEIRN